MQRLIRLIVVPAALLPLLTACGAPATAQQQTPTPTPLPPDPALERPTYVVERGPIERVLEITGRVTPVDLQQLSFKVAGRVVTVNVQRGDQVKAGDVLAELELDEALDTLRRAENALAQAQRDLESAQAQQEIQIAQAQNNLQQTRQDAAKAQAQYQTQVQQAQNNLEQARREAAAAQARHNEEVRQAELALRRAEENLARLLPGGAEDRVKTAQENLEAARRNAEETKRKTSEAKTAAERAVHEAGAALQTAQHAYSKAFWDNDWVEKYGTDPRQPTIINPQTGAQEPNYLTEAQKADYRFALTQAEQALRTAEQNVELAKRNLDLARADEITQNQLVDEQVAEAERALAQALQGPVVADAQIVAARRAVEDAKLALEAARRGDTGAARTGVANAQLSLEAARQSTPSTQASVQNAELAVESAAQGSYNIQQTAVEDAQADLDKARKAVDARRIVAPQDGVVIAMAIAEGDTVEAFTPVAEVADPSELEIAAELSGEQMRQLAEGQPATVSLLARPDIQMPATIRRLPAPYGAGGSGVVQEQDRTTRFTITDTRGQELTAGAVARIRVVLERKENVLLLPPDAVRAFEGRRFVIVREGERERRVPVRVGIETEERVEILEGVEEGDIVVGQ